MWDTPGGLGDGGLANYRPSIDRAVDEARWRCVLTDVWLPLSTIETQPGAREGQGLATNRCHPDCQNREVTGCAFFVSLCGDVTV